jgi:hypothetical protein
VARGGGVEGEPQGHQAEVDPQGELRIEVGIPGLPGHQAKAQVEQGAGETFAWVVPHPTGNQVGQQYAQTGGQGRSDAHAEQVLAKHRLAQGDQPIAAGRFFEIADAHEVRRHPVAAQQHLLADLGVTGLVGVHKPCRPRGSR